MGAAAFKRSAAGVSFWTPPGVYTVIDKAAKGGHGLVHIRPPVASSMGYKLTIPYATRISTDGIYHQLN